MTVIHLLVEILSINFEMDTLIVGSLYPDTVSLSSTVGTLTSRNLLKPSSTIY